MTFSQQLEADVALIEPALEKYLSRETGEKLTTAFSRLRSAPRDGRRQAPASGNRAGIMPPVRRRYREGAVPVRRVALEMIHTYSLIHDDLPCMDNDDLRRGRPTCHKAFDEAYGGRIAGDGLLTAAFETASTAKECFRRRAIVRCIRILGENAGMNGMIGGQGLLDIGAEHREDLAR